MSLFKYRPTLLGPSVLRVRVKIPTRGTSKYGDKTGIQNTYMYQKSRPTKATNKGLKEVRSHVAKFQW